jgi:hypothetical protein
MQRLSLILLVGLLAAAGCSTDTELGGVAIPNARPDTRITGEPPTLLEAGFVVHFNWSGVDADGRIVGYQWKISDNGLDGISPRDTLTHDPLTGAELNPWRFTTANDSTFYVLADQPDFPRDEASPRSFRTHSLFIRAVDDKGEVDATPAYISFTSTTIVPTAKVTFAQGPSTTQASRAPSTVNVNYTGTDPDYDRNVPTQVRYLWKRAQLADGTDIRLPVEYYAHYEELVDFDDPDWSTWKRYAIDENLRVATYTNQQAGQYWLFAVQMQDTAGAVSVGRRYGVEVAHFSIQQPGSLRPGGELSEPFLGRSTQESVLPISIAAGQPLNFAWKGDTSDYNGKIVSFQHGWDLVSVDDPADPGWAIPPGLSENNRFAEEMVFQEGTHTFTLKIVDDSAQQTVFRRVLNVVPYVDYELQKELMVIDQVDDERNNTWLDQQSIPRDRESYRNDFWSFLQSQPGGVNGLDWSLDGPERWYDAYFFSYANLVPYKAVLCYARSATSQSMFRQFRPEGSGNEAVDRFVWMIPYQRRGGNLFLVGGASMESFLEVPQNPFMTPVIFDTRELLATFNGTDFTVGFGEKELSDGNTTVDRGPLQYPYQIAGISTIDWTSLSTKYVYARGIEAMNRERKELCVGLKGIVLDPAFRQHWLIGPGALADTIYTEALIDWRDPIAVDSGTLDIELYGGGPFEFRNDEFYDANVSTRTTQWAPQDCEDLRAPGGKCVEPMFRGISRFDFVRQYRQNVLGETDWPTGAYTTTELDDLCGRSALQPYGASLRGTSRTNGKTYGFVSWKMTAEKPSQAPDVYWGFDPYRFEHEESKKAIRWVLKEIFRLDVLDP